MHKAPENITRSLKEKCPQCGTNLYSFWHTPSSDQPGLGIWYVECNSNSCNYEHDESYINLDWLAKDFTIIPDTEEQKIIELENEIAEPMEQKFTITKGTVESYKIRGVGNTFDWADIVVDARENTGRIQIASDNGSYQYYWDACGSPFKEFLIGLGIDYAASKFGESNWFDHEGTTSYLKERIESYAKSAEHRAVLLEEVEELHEYTSKESFSHKIWDCTEIMSMEDDLPHLQEKISPRFEAFWKNIWLVFIEELKKELAIVNS